MVTIMRVFFAFILLASLFGGDAMALLDPRPIATDHRIKTILYTPNEVFKFTGHYGYQSSIVLSPEEEVVTISIGDSLSWQVQPDGNRIFIKPTEQDAMTNMTVITNLRTYLFELHSREPDSIDDDELIFDLRFVYPAQAQPILDNEPEVPDVTKDSWRFNFNYTLTGSELVAPIRIFDDGQFTYFQFRNINADIPAIFQVNSDGTEALVNFRTSGSYIIVERVSSRYTLRHGSDVVCVYNESMPLGAQITKKRRASSLPDSLSGEGRQRRPISASTSPN